MLDTRPVEYEGLHPIHPESPLAARGPQTLDRAARLAAVAKVISDHHMPRPEPSHDELVHERLGAHAAHALVERQRDQSIDLERRQRREFFTPAREPRRRSVGIDEFLGARLEYQHGRWSAELGGTPLQRPNHLLMAEMHAIVISHGKNAAPASFGDTVETAH